MSFVLYLSIGFSSSIVVSVFLLYIFEIIKKISKVRVIIFFCIYLFLLMLTLMSGIFLRSLVYDFDDCRQLFTYYIIVWFLPIVFSTVFVIVNNRKEIFKLK